MKKLLLIFIVTFNFLLNAQSPTFSWAKKTSGTYNEDCKGVCTDSNGNVYSIGIFSGTVDFDPGVGTYTLNAATSFYDFYVLKLDPNGNFLWAKKFGSNVGDDMANSITIDSNNNVIVTGYFIGNNIDFDPNAGTTLLSSYGQNDIFILKLDPNGNLIWVKQIGQASGSDECYSITSDINSNVYLTGYFFNTIDFDPNAGIYNMTATPALGYYYIVKLNSLGDFVWAKQYGGNAGQYNYIGYGKDHNIYLTGGFSATGADFNPNSGVDSLYNVNNFYNMYVMKIDTSGNYKWAKTAGGSDDDISNAVTADINGNVYITGIFQSTLCPMGTTTLTNSSNTGTYWDVFTAKLDPFGNFIWAKKLGGNQDDKSFSVSIDNNSNVYTTGYYRTNVDFDPSTTSTFTLNSGTNYNLFIQKLDQNGNFQWAGDIGGTGTAYKYYAGNSIFLNNNNEILVGGNVTGTIDADPTSSTFTMTASATASNAFILKLNGSGTATFIKNHELSDNFNIYPNPSSQEITIELNSKNNMSQITITNYLGEQVIKLDNIVNNFQKLNINNLPAGIYQVAINTNNQILSSKFVIVK
jgi:hypothetical protein